MTLLHPEETLTVSALQAMAKCSLFKKNPTLMTSPYLIESPVSLSILREFVSELEGNPINITKTNLRELQRLCDEFGFEEFSAKLSQFFKSSNCSKGGQFGSVFAGMRSVSLNESIEFLVNGRVIQIEIAEAAALFPAVREQLLVDGCGRKFFVNRSGIETSDIHSLELILSGESISIRRSEGLLIGLLGNTDLEQLFLDCSIGENRMNLSASILSVETLDSLFLTESVSVQSEDALLRMILKLDPSYRDLLRHIQIGLLSEDGLSLLNEHFGIPPETVWECAAEWITHPPPPLFDSRIISKFPEIFAEFRKKHFEILWRGSRNGFKAKEFHRRCDGHANTLTVILDTKGNIFGGFTPVEWESPTDSKYGKWKADDSQKSFVFTLKNPHNIPGRRFALKDEMKDRAICCDSTYGPCFTGGIFVQDNCNAKTESWTHCGNCYMNDTGLDECIVFTGSKHFQVKEIEVFEITD